MQAQEPAWKAFAFKWQRGPGEGLWFPHVIKTALGARWAWGWERQSPPGRPPGGCVSVSEFLAVLQLCREQSPCSGPCEVTGGPAVKTASLRPSLDPRRNRLQDPVPNSVDLTPESFL